ncbi:hypothetical protein KY289_034520 [Solanum tuberosum]|nr:hypothetical protein KY289_034520 [Solanum tuberosum]
MSICGNYAMKTLYLPFLPLIFYYNVKPLVYSITDIGDNVTL